MKGYIPILILVISATVVFLYVRPQYDEILSLQATVKEYDDAIQRANEIGAKRDQLLQTYRNFNQSDMEKLRKSLPDKVDLVQLVVDINALAGKYGATIKDIKGSDAIPKKANSASGAVAEIMPYEFATLSFSTEMNYPSFMQFLADIEKNLRITDVSSMSLKENIQTGSTEYMVTVKTYWLK